MEPPNIAALFSPTVVSVKSSHGGGACPATTYGELHPSGGDDINFHHLRIKITILDKKYNYYQLSLSHYERWVGSKDEATHY